MSLQVQNVEAFKKEEAVRRSISTLNTPPCSYSIVIVKTVRQDIVFASPSSETDFFHCDRSNKF
jgi:hypothetical protein